MKGLLDYGALIAKIHAIRGKMFDETAYSRLASQGGVQEAVDYLYKNSSYSIYVKDFGSNVHRATLEKALHSAVFDDYLKLKNYLNSSDSAIVKATMQRYEIVFLKNAIRNCFKKDGPKRFNSYEVSTAFRDFAQFDTEAVIGATDMHSLMAALSGSNYYAPLKALYSRGKEPTLFEIETNLDIYYFTSLQKSIKKYFSGIDKKRYLKACGIEADVLNLLWIYRCKKYYKLQSEYIYALIIPVHGNLTTAQIRALVESDDFLAKLNDIAPSKLFTDSYSDAVSERMHLKAAISAFLKICRVDPYSVAAVLSYLMQKELETENVCSIIEGIRYNLNKEDIMKYVVI